MYNVVLGEHSVQLHADSSLLTIGCAASLGTYHSLTHPPVHVHLVNLRCVCVCVWCVCVCVSRV
jgi:tetrahydromethanopterin S-methyltransferase subunit C